MNRWLIIIAVVLAFYLYTSRKKKEAAGLSDTGNPGQGSNTAGTVIPSGSTLPAAATSTVVVPMGGIVVPSEAWLKNASTVPAATSKSVLPWGANHVRVPLKTPNFFLTEF